MALVSVLGAYVYVCVCDWAVMNGNTKALISFSLSCVLRSEDYRLWLKGDIDFTFVSCLFDSLKL